MGEIGRQLPGHPCRQGGALKLWFTVHPTKDTDIQLINKIPRLTNEFLSLYNHDITPYFNAEYIFNIKNSFRRLELILRSCDRNPHDLHVGPSFPLEVSTSVTAPTWHPHCLPFSLQSLS